MENGQFAVLNLIAAVVLSGCASTSSETTKVFQQKIVQLNQQMASLTHQATFTEQQNLLNLHSEQGAWLLAHAHAPVELQSPAGSLRLRLKQLTAIADGSQITLLITMPDKRPRQATIEWGKLDTATGKPDTTEAFSQNFTLPAPLSAEQQQEIILQLQGLPPQQLGYIRIYGVAYVR